METMSKETYVCSDCENEQDEWFECAGCGYMCLKPYSYHYGLDDEWCDCGVYSLLEIKLRS